VRLWRGECSQPLDLHLHLTGVWGCRSRLTGKREVAADVLATSLGSRTALNRGHAPLEATNAPCQVWYQTWHV
jgi:hypothetical protein